MLPVRGSAGAAGYDLCASGNYVIPSQGKGTIEIGLTVSLPRGTYARIASRSGLSIRHFIDVGAGVVDLHYQGDIKVVLFNHSTEDFTVQACYRSHMDLPVLYISALGVENIPNTLYF